MAQLVAHLRGTQEVSGSYPDGSTRLPLCLTMGNREVRILRCGLNIYSEEINLSSTRKGAVMLNLTRNLPVS